MIKLRKTHVMWNKPTIVGIVILEISKLLMYQFHYDVIQARYIDKARLLFTDTDSLCYHIETENVYNDLAEMSDKMDFSDYSKDHPLFSNVNKKALNKMKDETNGKPPHEFIGLRAKMYSLKLDDGEQKSTVKGIKKQFAKKNLKHQNYSDCFFGKTQDTATFNLIRSENHQLKTIQQTKISLSCYDDKRYIYRDSPKTLAYGHYCTLKRQM